MAEITGKLIAIGGAEDKGTELEKVLAVHHNLNFLNLAFLEELYKKQAAF
jgi:hypothetical protein